MLTRFWRWIWGPKPTPEQVATAERARQEVAERHEKAVDQYYEEGFPSREAQKGTFCALEVPQQLH